MYTSSIPVEFTSTEYGRNEWILTKKFITKVGQPRYSPDIPALWGLAVFRIEKWPESTEWNMTKLLKGIWENGFEECFQQWHDHFMNWLTWWGFWKTLAHTRAFGWDSEGMVNMQTFYYGMFFWWISFIKKRILFQKNKICIRQNLINIKHVDTWFLL